MSPTISAELFVRLDLVVEEPQTGHFPWVGDLLLAEVAREQTTPTLMLGRRTYATFASSWPERGDEIPLASHLNKMAKVVVSDHVHDVEATWAPTRILRHGGDIASAIAQLDEVEGRISVAGSVSLVEHLLAAGLLDELRLIVHPLILGSGRRLFHGWTRPRLESEHIDSTPLDRGARLDLYRPLPAPAH
jgi:dihydrofolate reductase